MKNFIESYCTEVGVPYLKWAGKHWKGLTVLTTILTIVFTALKLAYLFWDDITNWIQKKRSHMSN